MSKPETSVSTTCAAMALVGAILLIGTHHADSTDIWSIKSVHISMDILALGLISCPFISWFRNG